MENTANLGLFSVQKLSQTTRKEYMRMEKTPREKKLCISQLTKIPFYSFFYSTWDGLSLKPISRYCPFKDNGSIAKFLRLFLSCQLNNFANNHEIMLFFPLPYYEFDLILQYTRYDINVQYGTLQQSK
jgi:hypothetical protein